MKLVVIANYLLITIFLIGACTLSSPNSKRKDIEIQIWVYDEFFTVNSCDHMNENCLEKNAENLKKSLNDPGYQEPRFRNGLTDEIDKYMKKNRTVSIVFVGQTAPVGKMIDGIAHLRKDPNIKIIHSSLQRHI